MLSAFLYLILITAVAGAIAVGFNIRIGHAYVPSICVTGLAASVMLSLGAVEAVSYVLGAVALLCIGFIALRLFLEKKRAFYIITTEFVIFTVLAVSMIILNAGRLYSLFDEFSHWGLAVKNLFTVGKLPYSAETNSMFPGYPPFATVICYLGTCFLGRFSESATFVPIDMLLIASFLPVVTGYMRQCAKKGCAVAGRCLAAVPVAGLFCCILCFKLSAFTTIAVDTLIGALAFYVVWESLQAKRTIQIFSALIAAFALTLTKDTGIAFVIFAAIILFTFILVKNIKKKNGRAIFRESVARVLPLVLGPVMVKLFWNYVLILANTSSTDSGIFPTLMRSFTKGFSETQKTTVAEFFKAWIKPTISFGIPLVAVLAIFVLLQVGIILILKKIKFEELGAFTAVFVTVSVCFFVYCLGLLASYLTVFTAEEAVAVASFERYIGTYLTFWLLTIISVPLSILPGHVIRWLNQKLKDGKKINAALSVLSAAVVVAAALLIAFAYPHKAKDSAAFRAANGYGSEIPSLCEKEGLKHGDKIMFVSSHNETQLDIKLQHLIANYNAAPWRIEGMYDPDTDLNGGGVKYVFFDDIDDAALVQKIGEKLAIDDVSEIEVHKLYAVKGGD